MTTLDEKVRLLLDEEELVDFHPQPPPPLVDITTRVNSVSPEQSFSNKQTRLSPQAEARLVARLHAVKRDLPVRQPVSDPPRSLMNPRSALLARDLEPLATRSSKLLVAKARRLKEQAQAKEVSEGKASQVLPEINPLSRRLADRLTPAERQLVADEKRRILVREAKLRDQQECRFRPETNPRRPSRFPNQGDVVGRMTRDAQARRTRLDMETKAREAEILAECRQTPSITPLAKSMVRDTNSVHDRLYPRSASVCARAPAAAPVTFNEYVSRMHLRQSDMASSISNLMEMSSKPQRQNQLDASFSHTFAKAPTFPHTPPRLDLSDIFAYTKMN